MKHLTYWGIIVLLGSFHSAGFAQSTDVARRSLEAEKAQPICQSILVPSYMHPQPSGSAWDTLIADPPHTREVDRVLIANPASGPGRSENADFKRVVASVHRSGQKVYGYVATGYGKVPLNAAEAQVRDYLQWYGVDGIFVDEVSAEARLVDPYYQPLATYINTKILGGGVVLNHGTYPAAHYADIRVAEGSHLQLVVFEHDYGAFTAPSFHVPHWIRRHPASMFVNIVYGVSADQLPGVLRLSADRNVNTVYVTDQLMPNPYAALPSYWRAFDRDTQAGCAR